MLHNQIFFTHPPRVGFDGCLFPVRKVDGVYAATHQQKLVIPKHPQLVKDYKQTLTGLLAWKVSVPTPVIQIQIHICSLLHHRPIIWNWPHGYDQRCIRCASPSAQGCPRQAQPRVVPLCKPLGCLLNPGLLDNVTSHKKPGLYIVSHRGICKSALMAFSSMQGR